MKALTLFEIIIIILFEVNFILKYKNKTIKFKKKRLSISLKAQNSKHNFNDTMIFVAKI
jgi:hypothetical protein